MTVVWKHKWGSGMTLIIEKELFQWEKERFVIVNNEQVTSVQFYNKKSKYGSEVPVENGKAKIPNYLLKEDLPIIAIACSGPFGNTQVINRKEFKVLRRAKPEYYIDDDPGELIIYDGGMEV